MCVNEILSFLVYALSKIGGPALPSVLSTLKADVANPSRYDIVGKLGAFRDSTVVPFLLDEMKTSTRKCRRVATYLLGELKASEAVELLCELLSTCKDKDMLKTAIMVLGRIADPRATSSITPYLTSDSPHVREQCVRTLALLKCPRAFEPLLKALGDPLRTGDSTFWCLLLDALYRSDKARAAPVFIEHLRSPEPEVAHQARTCLIWIWKPLCEMKDYTSVKTWYDQLPKDVNGTVILSEAQ